MKSIGFKPAFAALVCVLLAADAAGPAWGAIARVSVSVKPAAHTPGVGMPTRHAPLTSPLHAGLAGIGAIGLGPTLIGVDGPDVNPIFSRQAVSAAVTPTGPHAPVRTARRAAPARPHKTLTRRIGGLIKAAAADKEAIRDDSGSGLHGTASKGFARLLSRGLIPARGTDGSVAPKASRSRSFKRTGLSHSQATEERTDFTPPTPEKEDPRQVRKYLLGTGIFKIGMEALGLSAPLIALTIFGQVKFAAVLVVGWGLSQIVFSSLSGGILDRRSPSKVLAVSMGLQALTVATLLGLFAADKFLPGLLGFPLITPLSLLVLYSLAGGFMGVSDTARQVIPPEITGHKERGLKLFNAKTHIAYEISGVLGALITGVIIANFGVIPALILHPPAYLLAALVFWGLNLAPRQLPSIQKTEATTDVARNPGFFGKGNPVARAVSDPIRGAKAVFSSPVFRWSTLALVIPLVTHRFLEGLLIPVTAKSFLANPSMAAWIIGASNLGELIGAIMLMRAILFTNGEKKRFRSSFWVRLMAVGSLGILALTFSRSLWVILPLIAFMSMTWASSELSLRSKLQNSLPKDLRGRAFAFIGALAFALILSASMGVGFLMDIIPHLTVFYGIDIALAAAAVILFFTAGRLNGPKTRENPSPDE